MYGHHPKLHATSRRRYEVVVGGAVVFTHARRKRAAAYGKRLAHRGVTVQVIDASPPPQVTRRAVELGTAVGAWTPRRLVAEYAPVTT